MSTDHNLFEEKAEPKRNRAEVLLLTSLRLTVRPNRLTLKLCFNGPFWLRQATAGHRTESEVGFCTNIQNNTLFIPLYYLTSFLLGNKVILAGAGGK